MARHRYLVALGSNIRHHRHGRPERVLRAALAELAARGIAVERVSPLVASEPVGPSLRNYANAAAIVACEFEPEGLLGLLQEIERRFGRRRGGRRWAARVLDLDIILWDGGAYAGAALVVPHPQFRRRDFVLRPCATVAPGWRDPLTGLTVRQLFARLTRPRPVPR